MAGGLHTSDMVKRIKENRSMTTSKQRDKTGGQRSFRPSLAVKDSSIARIIRQTLRVVSIICLLLIAAWMISILVDAVTH